MRHPQAAGHEWSQGLHDMLELAEALRAEPEVDDLVHIGIGGSGLGPEMALQALVHYRDPAQCPLRLGLVRGGWAGLAGAQLHRRDVTPGTCRSHGLCPAAPLARGRGRALAVSIGAEAFRQLLRGAQASTDQLPGHQDFPGNRPSTVLLLEELSPASLGALLALHEHRVFVAGAVWGINSFNQWGVELGKTLARDLEPRLVNGDTVGLDGSTAGLVRWVRGEFDSTGAYSELI